MVSSVLRLMVVVLFFVVVVVFLEMGRLEVGHWGKTLLTEVVFYCPPLHLILVDKI